MEDSEKVGNFGVVGGRRRRRTGGGEAINEAAGLLHQLSTMVLPESSAARALWPIGRAHSTSFNFLFFAISQASILCYISP